MLDQQIEENRWATVILDHVRLVHDQLGPGLLESAYKECLYHVLHKSGLQVEEEKPMPLMFQEVKLDCGYRIDLLVAKRVVVEIKSVEALNEVHLAQVLTCLKLGEYKLGLLINFNVAQIRHGIRRVVNGL